MVYVGALALLDFLSGSVTGPWVINNYVECGMGEDDSPCWTKPDLPQFLQNSRYVLQIS